MKTTIAQDAKSIYLLLKDTTLSEEKSVAELTMCVCRSVKAKQVRVLNCINYLCDLGMTIAEDEKDGKTYYSLLHSIDNNILYRQHLLNI